MKKVLFALTLGAVMASAAVVAAPAPYQDHDRYDHDHDRDDHHDHDRHDDRRDEHGHYVVVHDRGMHEGWYHRGGYVPAEYRDRRYVVEDWRTYHLAPPPRDYQWVRSDTGEFLLVAAATGLITDIVINSH
jgi:Ni/Co efflux regulator RcnB